MSTEGGIRLPSERAAPPEGFGPCVCAPQVSRHYLFPVDWMVHVPAAGSWTGLGQHTLRHLSGEADSGQDLHAVVEVRGIPGRQLGLATTSRSGSPVPLRPTASSQRQRRSRMLRQPPAARPSSRPGDQNHPPDAPRYFQWARPAPNLLRSAHSIAHDWPPHTIPIRLQVILHLPKARRNPPNTNAMLPPNPTIQSTIHPRLPAICLPTMASPSACTHPHGNARSIRSPDSGPNGVPIMTIRGG